MMQTANPAQYKPPTPPQSPVLSMAMASQIPSIGDILLLSQVAWRTARAFTSGRKGSSDVPPEFLLIEVDLNHLSKELKQLAEFFVSESVDSFVSSADQAAQDGIGTIIMSCRRTLDGLEAFTSRYQTNSKKTTSNGFTLERQWNANLLANYDQPIWGSDERSIINLHDMLRMHAVTVTMLKVILQRLSREGLEMGVIPIAEKIIDGYKFHPSDLNGHLAEIRGLAEAIVGEIPSPSSSTPATPTPAATPRRLSIFNLPPAATGSPPDLKKGLAELTPISSTQSAIPAPLEKTKSRPNSQHLHIINFSWPKGNTLAEPSSAPISPMTEVPPDGFPGFGDPASLLKRAVTSTNLLMSNQGHRRSISHTLRHAPTWGVAERTHSPDSMQPLTIVPTAQEEERKKVKRVPSYTFERLMFRNAVILCDVRGTAVEYTTGGSTGSDRLEHLSNECRIRIIRKKRVFPDGQIEYSTSIWSFSDDLTVRLEQQIDETQEIIPYTSFFEPKKVSIPIQTTLILHAENPRHKPLKTVKTRWVNYYFATPECSSEFQTRLFGRTLRASFKTEKTVRIHEGLASMIAPHEQMCALENLRVWDEEETGAVLAIIHFSAMYRPGYMKFYLNDARYPIVIKDESTRSLRIKGLRIPLMPIEKTRNGSTPGHHHHFHLHHHKQDGQGTQTPPKEQQQLSKSKMVTTARIDFSSEAEKLSFVALVREVQKGMVDIEHSLY